MSTPSKTATAPQPRHNILVIDDELGPRESLRILFHHRHHIQCVDNVDAGLQILKTTPPDVIIMDIKMPRKNGIEGLRDIRRIDPHVSIIMLTGFGDFDTATAALRLGATDYQTKPFNVKEFGQLVDRHIERTIATRNYAQAANELAAMNSSLNEELQQREHLASLGAKSSEFIHDLSNPFAIICMCVQMLTKHLQTYDLKEHQDTKVINDFVKNITSSAQRCKDLFDLWRKAENNDTLTLQPYNLHGLLQDVADRANVLASQKGATVRLQDHLPHCQILADETQLFRCFQNLVTNAVQAVPPTNGVVDLSWHLSDGRTEIRIQDNGCGIAPDALDKIFNPHFTTKKDSGGLGLGLFITKKLIELHHGTIRLANNPDQGATATVSLPVYTPKTAERPLYAMAATPQPAM